LFATQKEKTLSLKTETLKSPQSPPRQASKQSPTRSSDNLKFERPNKTTMMKCPEVAEGCTLEENLFLTSFEKLTPCKKLRPNDIAS
jgi:hypothetical protein